MDKLPGTLNFKYNLSISCSYQVCNRHIHAYLNGSLVTAMKPGAQYRLTVLHSEQELPYQKLHISEDLFEYRIPAFTAASVIATLEVCMVSILTL
jgi:hypothetical protein